MPVSFAALLSDVLTALGDGQAQTWSRVNTIWPWCIEAMRTFPFGRPMRTEHVVGTGEQHKFDLPDDFRELISVEYPVGKIPPKYLIRKSHFDPEFWNSDQYYDVDHNYEDGTGWIIYFSMLLDETLSVYIEYLATHDLDMIDDDDCYITVPDQYYGILIAQVMCRAYRERLSYFMQDPTVHTSIIQQLTDMVRKAEDRYYKMVEDAWEKLSPSRVSPRQAMDSHDRVY